jgi:hypothetical protein
MEDFEQKLVVAHETLYGTRHARYAEIIERANNGVMSMHDPHNISEEAIIVRLHLLTSLVEQQGTQITALTQHVSEIESRLQDVMGIMY